MRGPGEVDRASQVPGSFLRGGPCRRNFGGATLPVGGFLSNLFRFGIVGALRGRNRGCLAVVIGDQFGKGVLPFSSQSLEPTPGSGVQPSTVEPGQGLVGDLPNQNVAKAVEIASPGTEQISVEQLVGALRQSLELGRERLHPGQAERAAEDGAQLDGSALAGRQ